MTARPTTFSGFVLDDLRRAAPGHDAALGSVLNDLQRAGKLLGAAIARAALPVAEGRPARFAALAADTLTNALHGGEIGAVHLAESAEPFGCGEGGYVLVASARSGADSLDVNAPAGLLWGVLRARAGAATADRAAVLVRGRALLAAGYFLFGPLSLLAVTLGAGVHGFALDRDAGAYTLTRPDMRIPERACELAADMARAQDWNPPLRRFARECVDGDPAYTVRWMDSLVPELHRVLVRGGVALFPRAAGSSGLYLVTEAVPLSWLVEQAGGATSTGREPILGIVPDAPGQRVACVFGSRSEVERVERFHRAHDRGEDEAFAAPLFRSRTIFRTV